MSRNPGMALDLDWVRQTALDEARTADRARSYAGRSSADLEPPLEVEALRTAVRCLDLTSLSAADPGAGVDALCADARAPLSGMSALDEQNGVTVAAVCVFPAAVPAAVAGLRGTAIPVAAACGFPDGETPVERLVAEIRQAGGGGAAEIDAVLDRNLIADQEWTALYDRVRLLRDASADRRLKLILRSGTLPTASHIARASLVAAMAGADFIKTSTGSDPINATLDAGIAMTAAIRAYRDRTGFRVGLKPAGGLRTAGDALDWLGLARGELGTDWMTPHLFRLGASSLLRALRDRLGELEPS